MIMMDDCFDVFLDSVCENFTEVFLFFFFLVFGFWFLVFGDRVSLYSPGCPGTHFVDQVDLELRNQPASVSQVLVVKA